MLKAPAEGLPVFRIGPPAYGFVEGQDFVFFVAFIFFDFHIMPQWQRVPFGWVVYPLAGR